MDYLVLPPHFHALYGSLHVYREDISVARQCAAFLQKKNWHSPPFYRRGGAFLQQVSFTTTLVVAYARPFCVGKGNNQLPQRLIPYSPDELALHRQIISLRNKVYAHTDRDSYQIKPLKGKFIKSIDSLQYPHFSVEETTKFLSMTGRLIASISARMENIRGGAVEMAEPATSIEPEPPAGSPRRRSPQKG